MTQETKHKKEMPSHIFAQEDLDFNRWWSDTTIPPSKKFFSKYVRADIADELLEACKKTLDEIFHMAKETEGLSFESIRTLRKAIRKAKEVNDKRTTP